MTFEIEELLNLPDGVIAWTVLIDGKDHIHCDTLAAAYLEIACRCYDNALEEFKKRGIKL
jgi:hypothetical protein